MTPEQIIALFQAKPRHAARLLIQDEALLNAFNNQPGSTVAEQAYNYCYPGRHVNTCELCKKTTGLFTSFTRGYQRFCSPKCAANAPGAREASKEASRAPEVRKRIKETLLTKYGVTCGYQLPEVKAKVTTTVNAKYGVSHAFQAPTVKAKAQALTLSVYATGDRWTRRLDLISKLYKVELLDEPAYKQPDFQYTWKHSCGVVFKSRIKSGGILACPACKQQPVSMQENELAEFISAHVKVERNVRTIIAPLELDIYCPELSLAVEFNGLYWHSELKKSHNYHLQKTLACKAKGITLIHVFEDEWLTKRERVKARLLSILGVHAVKLNARACQVLPVPADVAAAFLEAYHLQGAIGAAIRLGLYHRDELVALMTFGKPRYSKNTAWELLRFAVKAGFSVRGAAGKLLAKFRAEHAGSIISYADRRWSVGKLYETLGFTNVGASPPSYRYMNGDVIISRFAAQKHKLSELLDGAFDSTFTEVENMHAAGYVRIFDCGTLIYKLEDR